MEAIIKLSPLSGREMFDRSSLPPEHLLCNHIDAENFLELANQGR